MTPAVLAVWALAPAIGAAGTREIATGVELLHFRTAATALNRDDVLGLQSGTDLLRGSLSWKESQGSRRGVFRGVVERRLGTADDRTDLVLRESYLQIAGVAGTVRAGKQRVAWGSGFAWNPTNRLEAPKNPLNTSLEQEGVWGVRADWTPTSVLGLTLVGARIETRPADLPIDLPETRHEGAAGRLRLLIQDTDVALVVSVQDGRHPLFGLDLGRSLGGSVAAHAEAALYRGSELPPHRPQIFVRTVAGLLYTRGEQAFALEYFHNGEGYGDSDRAAWLADLDASYRAGIDPSAPPPLRDLARLRYLAGTARAYEGLGVGCDYLHASWTRSRVAERWGLSLRGVVSITDGGIALTPGVSYAPGDRLTFYADGLILLGPSHSEYRLSPVRGGLVTRARVAF